MNYIVSTKKGKDHKIGFYVFLAALAFLVIFLMYNMLSGNTTVALKSTSKTYYAIHLGERKTLAEAEMLTSSVKLKSGAGIVYEGKKYYALAFIYNSERAAKDVFNRLKPMILEGGVVKIEISSRRFKTKEQLEYFNISLKNLDKLYANTVSLEKGEISLAAYTSSLIEFKNQLLNDFDINALPKGYTDKIKTTIINEVNNVVSSDNNKLYINTKILAIKYLLVIKTNII